MKKEVEHDFDSEASFFPRSDPIEIAPKKNENGGEKRVDGISVITDDFK